MQFLNKVLINLSNYRQQAHHNKIKKIDKVFTLPKINFKMMFPEI